MAKTISNRILRGSVVRWHDELWIVLKNTRITDLIPLINEHKTAETDQWIEALEVVQHSEHDEFGNLVLNHPTIKLGDYKDWWL